MPKLSYIQKLFQDQAKKKKRKIAIGIVRPIPETVESLKKASKYADLTVVGPNIKGLNCLPTESDDESSHKIITLLKEGKIEGFVRGQVKDSYTHHLYEETFNRPKSKYKVIPATIAKEESWFSISSPSNYNALDLKSKKVEVEKSALWLESLGIEPKIAIMSTRRLNGRVGEFGLLEEIAKRCEETTKFIKEKRYDVKEYYIEYEKAVWEDRNLMAPSIGMIGNTWLKGLVYLGGWTFVATPFLDQGTYYDDTARNNKNWLWPIISTVAWINREG